MKIVGLENRAHAHAIAAFVQRRGAAYSGELLDEFGISHQTLRRRRPQLARLGVCFVPYGSGLPSPA
jgi:DeoR/GlpR family transcriptional regulator of sugar metabolism